MDPRPARDRALEQGLREVLGGDTPPDRSFEILRAIQAAGSNAEPRRAAAQGSHARRPRALLLGLSLGTAAGLLLSWALLRGPAARTVTGPALLVRVTAGAPAPNPALLVRSSEGLEPASQGDPLRLHPRPRDLWHNPSALHTHLQVGGGSMQLSPLCRVEIRQMQWKDFSIGFGGGTLTVMVLAGTLNWSRWDGERQVQAGETARLELQDGRLQAEEGVVRKRLAEAEAEIARLRDAAARRSLATKEDKPAARTSKNPDAAAAKTFEPLHKDSRLAGLLAKADLVQVSKTSVAVNAKTLELLELLAAGKEIPRKLRGEIRSLMGQMHQYGADVEADPNVEGMNFETKVRSPLVGANWMAAMLQTQGLALDPAQRDQLSQLSQRYDAMDRQRRVGYAEDVPMLQRYLEEVDMQERFYEDAGRMLTEAQRKAVYPDKFKGRIGTSLIGPGSAAWEEGQYVRLFRDRADFNSTMTNEWTRRFQLDPSKVPALRQVIDRWAQKLPQGTFTTARGPLDKFGYRKVNHVRQSLQAQISFIADLQRSVALNPAQLKSLLAQKWFVVPYRR